MAGLPQPPFAPRLVVVTWMEWGQHGVHSDTVLCWHLAGRHRGLQRCSHFSETGCQLAAGWPTSVNIVGFHVHASLAGGQDGPPPSLLSLQTGAYCALHAHQTRWSGADSQPHLMDEEVEVRGWAGGGPSSMVRMRIQSGQKAAVQDDHSAWGWTPGRCPASPPTDHDGHVPRHVWGTLPPPRPSPLHVPRQVAGVGGPAPA